MFHSMTQNPRTIFTEWAATLPFWSKALTAFVAGALMVPAMPPWGVSSLLLIGLSVFFILLHSISTARAALALGWLFGFGYFLFGLLWIGNALLVEGNEYLWAWPLAVAGLPAALAFFHGFAAYLYKKIFPGPARWSSFIGFIAITAAAEFLRGHLFTGFPWNLYGYTWAHWLPVAQFASIAGIYGLNLLTIFWAALPGYLLLSPERRMMRYSLAGLALLSFAGIYGWGQARLNAHPTVLHDKLALRLVQPNIAQEDKWDPAKRAQNLNRHLELSMPQPINSSVSTLILWPETAISDFTLRTDEARDAIRAVLQNYEMPVFLATGHLRYQAANDQEPERFFNSLTIFDRDMNRIASYDKSHLVPFGEYIPFQDWIPLRPVVDFTGFVPGKGPETITIPDIGTISPLVCYEIIFPGNTIDKQSQRPNWIANVTNDAWYGDSAGPHQHFTMTVFRAIEEGVPAIRSANTGISGVIDPAGRTIHKIPLMQAGGINVTLPQALDKAPFFARHGHAMFLLFSSLLFLIGAFTASRERIPLKS